MSADLMLIAAPDSDEWRAKWTFFHGAEFIGAEEDDPRDEQGYATMGNEETGIIRGLSYEQWNELREELGIDGMKDDRGFFFYQSSW